LRAQNKAPLKADKEEKKMAIAKAVTEIGFPVGRFVFQGGLTLGCGRKGFNEILLPRLIHIKGGKLPVAGSGLFGKISRLKDILK
jgi:hypothetical protein